MTAANGTPDSAGTGVEQQVDRDLRDRVRWLQRLAIVYLLLTFALFAAAAWIYLGAADRAAKDAETLTRPEELRAVDFHDTATNPGDGTVTVVGDDSSILVFSDDGDVERSYKRAGGTRSSLRSIAFSGDGRTAVVAGDDGVILVSGDRGKSWNTARSNTGNDFTGIALSKDGEIAVAVGDRGLIRISRDGGRTWVAPEPANVTSKHLNGVALSDSGKTVVAVADDDSVLVSMNEGRRWPCIAGKTNQPCSRDNAKHDLEAVAFRGEGDTAMAVAVGDGGTILVSCDGSRKWRRRDEVDRKRRFYAVAFSERGLTAVAVGRHGEIWTSDGLCTHRKWTSRDTKAGNSLEAVALNEDGRIAVAVGGDGTVLVSRDRGVTWRAPYSRTAHRLHAVTFSRDGRSATAVGDESTILRLSLSPSGATPDEVTLLNAKSILKKSTLQERDQGRIEAPEKADKAPEKADKTKIASIYTIIERIGIVFIVLVMVQYLMSLARYNLRLAAFYKARRDTIRLAEKELPRPESIDELERMMQALSPDDLDFGRASRNPVNLAMQLARSIRGDGKSSAG